MLVMAAMLLAGCSGIQLNPDEASLERATIQVATIKVITESESITKAEVLERVETARFILDGDQMISLDDLATQVVSTAEWQALDPVDRSYLAVLFQSIETEAAGVGHVLSEEDRQTLTILLDWIEEAAKHAVDDGNPSD